MDGIALFEGGNTPTGRMRLWVEHQKKVIGSIRVG